MSAQSIINIDQSLICDKIDEYLICEGKYFINMMDYDLKMKMDYDKLDLILWLNKVSEKCDKKEALIIIDKILK